MLAALIERAHLFNDGNVDVLVVETSTTTLPSAACVRRVAELLREKTNGRHVVAFAGGVAAATCDGAAAAAGAQGRRLLDNHGKDNVVLPVYKVQFMTQTIATGLGLAFLLIFLLLCGFSALLAVPTPERFQATPLTIGKEY
jgi:hypothetical protein